MKQNERAAPRSDNPDGISRTRRNWALAVLTLTYACSMMDRMILSILQQPIKEEMHLTDGQLGLLSGFAFALLFSLLGLPAAYIAERVDRRKLIACSILAWSIMTSLCGAARGYGALFLFRMGVSVGEAGSTPPTHSLIADYFSPAHRSIAFSVFALGTPIGLFVGSVAGGYFAQHYGWRTTFFIFGLPGLLLALLVRYTLREPRRGAHDEIEATRDAAAVGFLDAARHILSRPAVVHVILGPTLGGAFAYAFASFAAVYLIRNFHVSLAEVGLVLGIGSGLFGGIGAICGGLIMAPLLRRDPRWGMWWPAIGLCIAAPLFFGGLLAPTFAVAAAFFMIAPAFHYATFGPSMAALHSLLQPRMRATAAGIYLLWQTIIGLGVGSAIVGFASDFIASIDFRNTTRMPFSESCPGGVAPQHSGDLLMQACRDASALGIRGAMLLLVPMLIWGAAHYLLSARAAHREAMSG